MMRALSTAGTGMVAQQYNLDTIANNLANVNTNAFKGQRADFQDLMYQTYKASGAQGGGSNRQPSPVQVGLGSMFASMAANLNQGTLQPTGRTFDLAISGEGYFQVEMPDGTTAYTRDGSFGLDANRQLVTGNGALVIPTIQIPEGATTITIASNGSVSASVPGQNEPQPLGQITVALFPNPAGLTRIGQNLYVQGGASGEPVIANPTEQGAGTINQGMIEGSNVQIVEEMVKMILAQRAYEINSKAVQSSDDMLQVLNNLKR